MKCCFDLVVSIFELGWSRAKRLTFSSIRAYVLIHIHVHFLILQFNQKSKILEKNITLASMTLHGFILINCMVNVEHVSRYGKITNLLHLPRTPFHKSYRLKFQIKPIECLEMHFAFRNRRKNYSSPLHPIDSPAHC